MNEMKAISVNSLGLSVRATNALKAMKIETLEQLLKTPIEDIAKGKNIGTKTVTEIEGFIVQFKSGNINIDDFAEKESAFTQIEHTFSENELMEMSQWAITELNLSNRAMNALMRIGCNTIAKLALISEKKLREMKGLGTKTCDEILYELSNWLNDNIVDFNTRETSNGISIQEKEYYMRLSEILNPITQLSWKQLREIVNESCIVDIMEFGNLESIDDSLISKVIKLSAFDKAMKKFFLSIAPSGVTTVETLLEAIQSANLEFSYEILCERLLDGNICVTDREVCYINRFKISEYLENYADKFEDRSFEILTRRIQGESLQEIGDIFCLSRERIRQILSKTVKKISNIYDDYYREPYEYFKFTKEEFCNAFPECGAYGYEFLFIKYRKGKVLVSEESVKNYSGLFSERMNQFWREEIIRKDQKHVTRLEMIYRVLLSNMDKALSMEEFETEYYDYIQRRNYPRERLTINIRSVANHLRTAPHIVFDKDNCVRYCEANPEEIWKNIDFHRYKDLVISSELIYRDYIELMEELDIRDGYELFYVIKSSLDKWNNDDFEICCRRVPVIVMGKGDEAKQALQLLKEISPIDFYGYYDAYEERFGVRSANGNPVITGALVNYYLDGEYSVDVTAIEDHDAEALREILSEKNFWFIDEVEKLFEKICIHSSEDAFNKAAFKRIGYSLNIGYVYNDKYGTVVNYFDKEIFSRPILDLNEYDRRLLMLSAFGSALYKKRMELEYIEVAPKIFMTISELERNYGITLADINVLQKWINSHDEKYFNAHSVWTELKNSGLDAKLQENEWLCTCIFRQQQTVFSLQVAGGIILCKDSSELNLGLICQWLVDKKGKMTVQNLTLAFNDTFATRIPVSKIAERLKAYGLWNTLVTDSYDDYIDNLVVRTEADMMDVDDLLQEEFF